MGTVKKALTAFILVGVLVSLVGCGSESDDTGVSGNQVVTVQRGDLAIDITAAGNLALLRTEDLAFEIAGTVEEVFVEEGDIVEEGQVLARLDTSEWEEYLETLEDELTAVTRQLTTKERGLTTTERQLAIKKRNVTAKELTLRQEQLDLQTAEYNLSEIVEVQEEKVQEAQDALDDAERQLATKKRNVTAKELTLRQEQLDLQTAEYNLSESARSKRDFIWQQCKCNN